MATFKLKGINGIRQLNLNDTAGELWSTFNIDMATEPNKIKLARPYSAVLNTTELIDESPAGDPVVQAIVYGDVRGASGDVFVLTNDKLFRSVGTANSFSELGFSIDEALDACIFDGKLIVTTSGNLDYHTGDSTYTQNWWTARGNPALQTVSSGVPANGNFIIFTSSSKAERLIVLDGSTVYSYVGTVSSKTNLFTLPLSASQKASCVTEGDTTAYIGTTSTTGEDAQVVIWDMASINADKKIPTGSKAVLAIAQVDNVPLIVTERGDIKLYNGAGFTRIAQFPFATKPEFLNGYKGLKQTQTIIHPKGIWVENKLVYFMINPASGTTPIDERSPAGLWCLNLENRSLTHVSAIGGDSDTTNNSPLLMLNNESAGRVFYAGYRGYGDNTDDGLFREDLTSTTNFGYFVTTEVESDTIQDVFKDATVKALLGASDEIVVKYRTSNDTNYPLISEGVTWATTTRFNTTDDLSYVKTRFDANNYDEVEIIKGAGTTGILAHITNIEFSGNTYQVTIDEALGTVDEMVDVRFDNWKKVPKTMTATELEYEKFGLDANGTWLQVKVGLKGNTGLPEVRDVIIKSNAKEQQG